jgi:hypothetical protein
MNTAHAASMVLLLGLCNCDRIHALIGGGDSGTAGDGATGSGELPALAGFEGEIDMSARTSATTPPVPFSLLVKGDVVRMDVPSDVLAGKDARMFTGGGKVYVLLRTAEKKAFVVFDAKQQAVDLDLNQVAEQAKTLRHAAPGTPDAPPSEPPKVVKTGSKDTVAGFACENWDVLNPDKSTLKVCVADKGASFFHLPLTGIPTESAWALELLDGNHFPLRGVAFDKKHTEVGRVELTKIDKHPLDAAVFVVPQGYKHVTIEELLSGLGGSVTPPDVPPTPPDPPAPSHHGSHGPRHHGKK